MKMIVSEKGQCVAASFAMCMDLTLGEMLNLLVHSGLRQVTDLPYPNNLLGHHIQEFVTLLLTRGYALTTIEVEPKSIRGDVIVNHAPYIWDDPMLHFRNMMNLGNGVVYGMNKNSGNGHAMAWDSVEQMLYDPAGRRLPAIKDEFPFSNFQPRQFFLMQKVI